MMTSILKKEFKYLAPYAAVIFLVMILLALWGTYVEIPKPLPLSQITNATAYTPARFSSWFPVLAPDLLWAAPFIALYVALLQCLSEKMTGNNSFLIQRPISLTKIFWCKAVVGIGLALLVTGVPFVGQEIWRFYSNRFPLPAHWEWPNIYRAVLLCIASWMAVIVTYRQRFAIWARPFQLMGLYTIFAWPAVVLLVPVIYTIAAFQSFVSNEDERRLNWLSLTTLGLISGAGIGTFLSAMLLLLGYGISHNASVQEWNYSLQTGQFCRVKSVNNTDVSWHYLNGPVRPLPHPPLVYKLTPISSFQPVVTRFFFPTVYFGNRRALIYDSVDYVFRQYDLESGHLIGIIDQSGFRKPTDRKPLQPIILAGSLAGPLTFVSSKAVESIDLRKEKLNCLYAAPANDKIVQFFDGADDVSGKEQIMLVSHSMMTSINMSGHILASWALPRPGAAIEKMSDDADTAVLWYSDSRFEGNIGTAIVMRNGREYSKVNLVTDQSPASLRGAIGDNLRILIRPPLETLFRLYDRAQLESIAGGVILALAALSILLSLIGIQILAWLEEWSFAERFFWSLAALPFGLSAFLGASALYKRPIRLPCPSCQTSRLIETETCPRCGAAWLPADANGDEIFEPGSYASRSVSETPLRKSRPASPAPILRKATGTVTPIAALFCKEGRPLLLQAAAYGGVGMFFVFATTTADLHKGFAWPTLSFFGCGMYLAALLAVGQFAAESRDAAARAFAVNRPVSAIVQFTVKLVTALICYVVVLGGIVAAYYIYSGAPDRLGSPFPQGAWNLALRDCALGMLLWFAMASAMLQSKGQHWRRALPLLFCAGASMVAHNTVGLFPFIAITAAAYLLLGVTTFGFFLGNGETSVQPKIIRPLFALVVAGAFVFFLLFGEMIGKNYVRNWSGMHNPGALFSWRQAQESFVPVNTFEVNTPMWYADFTHDALLQYSRDTGSISGIIDANGYRHVSVMPTKIIPVARFDERLPDLLKPIVFYKDPAFGNSWKQLWRYEHPLRGISTQEQRFSWNPSVFGLDGLILLTAGVSPQIVFSTVPWSILFGLVLTVLLCRRLRWTRGISLSWLAASFVFGLYVPLIILALYPLPLCEECPHCKRKRLISKETCEYCGSPWPMPALSGTEIFESMGDNSRQESLMEK
jgi:sorbitol-specific phosphotransferase system component IIC